MEEEASAISSIDINTETSCKSPTRSPTDKNLQQVNKKRRTLLQLWRSLYGCSTYSSCHGMSFITADSRFNIKVILWTILLLVAIILLFYSLGAITSRFINKSTYQTSNYHFPTQIDFPAITFCNINPLKYSTILRYNLSLEQADLFIMYTSQTAGVSSIPVSLFAGFAQQYDAARGGNNTLLQDMGHAIEDMIISCTFDGRPCSAQDFITRSTSVGLCHTFNPDGNLTSYHIRRPGHRYGKVECRSLRILFIYCEFSRNQYVYS